MLFPSGLLEWAGHKSGGVKQLFHGASGRPSGALIATPLLQRLRDWATAIAGGKPITPRIVLLVGGPGNGKTEAVEETVRALEDALAIDGELQAVLQPLFAPTDGSTVPRLVHVDLRAIPGCASHLSFTLVQDASVRDAHLPGRTPAALLVDDLESALAAGAGHLYLACVNRGVLDDALIHATETEMGEGQALLESIVRAVGTSPVAPSCWPLARHPEVAIWPMDVESLLIARPAPEPLASPASQIISLATDKDRWPDEGSCPAGQLCPFCRNRALLSSEPHTQSVLRILRWYELATGKRWSFRDIFSLVSFLLAGSPPHDVMEALSPCEWAARLIESGGRLTTRPDPAKLSAPFVLLACQYQHVLFSTWPRLSGGGIRAGLRELKLDDNATLLGLHYFLTRGRDASVPSTLLAQLTGLCDALDPALADPDWDVEVSGRSSIRLRDLDARFSYTLRDGLKFIRPHQCLSPLEVNVLSLLADADDVLGDPEVWRRKPKTAARLQMLIREFACRMVRRSIGARAGVVRGHFTLQDFEKLVEGDDQLMHQAVKQVEGLLNDRERFVVILNTTFGEPLPPDTRRVVLTTPKQKVRSSKASTAGRPSSDIRFLTVGSNTSTQSIPLTYELFRSVRDLQGGMLAASLPGTVIALLDTTRARLAGSVVRDDEQLDGAEIRIGVRRDVIVREQGTFLVRQEEGQ